MCRPMAAEVRNPLDEYDSLLGGASRDPRVCFLDPTARRSSIFSVEGRPVDLFISGSSASAIRAATVRIRTGREYT